MSDTTPPVTAEDLRERYAEAAAEWALMYPISSWALREGEAAEKLAKIWGRQIARYLTEYVRDEELERLRATVERVKTVRDGWYGRPHMSDYADELDVAIDGSEDAS